MVRFTTPIRRAPLDCFDIPVAPFIHSFVLFVLFGGLLALKWPRAIWFHLPAVAWGAFVEFSGWSCPLTPLENWLRTQGEAHGYSSDFIAHYVLPVLYPTGLTREIQIVLGVIVPAVNCAVYGWLWKRACRAQAD
ncbi:MAG: DUF2784 domain-containing protein [Nitrospira defluvii]|nr:DUF2784 domain-containing protein [Nitrospira defluvii]